MVFKEPTFHGLQPEVEAEIANRASLEAAVSNAIAVAGGIDGSEVEVTADGSDITLTGTVATVEEIERAAVVAKAVAGVQSVRNLVLLDTAGRQPLSH